MIDKLFLFTNQEILFTATYIGILFASMYISLKRNIQPILSLLLLFTISLIYLTLTSVFEAGFLYYFPGMESLDSLSVFPGVFGVLIAIKLMKSTFRIPYVVIDKILGLLFIVFAVFQINEYLLSNTFMSSLMIDLSLPTTMGLLQMNSMYLSASMFPELVLNNPVIYTLIIAFLTSTAFLYISSKFKYPGNSLMFTMIVLMAILFIHLFRTYPAELPALNDRMMGLNVFQWGLTLTIVLMAAFLIAKEGNSNLRKKETLFKPPGDYKVLIIYLSISLLALQVSAILNDLYVKLLFIGYFILTSYMIFYFMKKVERHYLKYGTVSIIMLIFIFFLLAQNPKTNQAEINAPEYPIDLGIKTIHSPEGSDKSNYLISFVPASNYTEAGQYIIPQVIE